MLLVSDIHFGHNEPEDIDALMAVARDPSRTGGLVIICGDFTSSGRTREYEQATELVREIIEAGNTVVVTPGNHDFGITGVGTDHGNWIPGFNKVGRKRFREHLMPLVLAQPAVFAHDDFDTITRHGDDVFVAVRSTHRGSKRYLGIKGVSRIKRDQIAWAKAELVGLSYKRLWFVTHRSVWGDAKHGAMTDRGHLEEQLFDEVPFEGFIHGHNHNFVFEETTTPELGIPMLHIAIPTLSTRGGDRNRAFLLWDGDSTQPKLIAQAHKAGPFIKEVCRFGRRVAWERGVVQGVLSAVLGAAVYGTAKALVKIDQLRSKTDDQPGRRRAGG